MNTLSEMYFPLTIRTLTWNQDFRNRCFAPILFDARHEGIDFRLELCQWNKTGWVYRNNE